ncbi:MAG TPA: YceI family protein [Bryobacteraceae bacterium]|jgi:polyisoprenoid-binding protein YceI|nr:YceI family protein [Bryobacteraceae bacterium]
MSTTYEIDPAHSHVSFSIRHLMISNVRGVFSGAKGTIVFDPQNPADSSIEVEIDVNTISTHDTKRDEHLKSGDFFDAAKYSTMTFKSKKIEKTGDDEYKVTGDLTIHGVTKEVTFEISDVSPETTDPWGNIRVGATAKGKINRKDFGLEWNAPMETGGVLVGNDVKIEMDIQAVKAKSAAA